MYEMITGIKLQNFRSYKAADFKVGKGVNIIVGPNASGKTNLLEAVLVVARGGSYRAKDIELIGIGSDWARVDLLTKTNKRILKLRNDSLPSKTFEIDDQIVQRLHASKKMPVVLFEPNHLLMLSGSPELRRSFLDEFIEQMDSSYAHTRRHYKRVLAQRNSLLKNNPKALHEQLFVWNVRLSELGAQMVRKRLELVERINQVLPELYKQLGTSNKETCLKCVSRFNPENYESQLLHKLEANPELEAMRGFTAYGPHREDFETLLDGKNVGEVASRGEIRTIVLALKIIELKMLEEKQNQKPLLLLDDVFSELDAQRRLALTKVVADFQTFITTTNADAVSNYFKNANIINLSLTTPSQPIS